MEVNTSFITQQMTNTKLILQIALNIILIEENTEKSFNIFNSLLSNRIVNNVLLSRIN